MNKQDYLKDKIHKVIPIGNLFQLRDPSDGAGLLELEGFRLYQSYQVQGNRLDTICQKLYQKVLSEVSGGNLGDAKLYLNKYVQEFQNRNSLSPLKDERLYIVITRRTPKNTQTTVFIRFHGYGSHLYLGVDTYFLGGIRWKSFLKKCFTTVISFIIFVVLLGLGGVQDLNQFLWFIIISYITFTWWDLIRRIFQAKEIYIVFALRQVFMNNEVNFGTFDIDDSMMFLKPTLHTAIWAIRDILNEEELPIQTLDEFMQNININQTFTGSVGSVAAKVHGNVTNINT
jgi:hypothetical protein